MKIKPVLRGAVVLLFTILTLLSIPACKQEEETVGAEPTLSVNSNGELTLAADLDARILQSHAGQMAGVFELAPGETSIAGKRPIAEDKVSAKLRFRFPLDAPEGGGTGFSRLYSSYLIIFSDGTALSNVPCSLSNTGKLARDHSAFPRSNEMKGLNAADEELSRRLHSSHTLIEIKTSDLLATEDGETTSPFLATLTGESLFLDAGMLAHIDRKVKAATQAGMQVSICLTPDAELPMKSYAVLFDTLADRYSGGENGKVSAFLIGENAPRTSQNAETLNDDAGRAASLLRIAHLALTSRVENGRVYICASGTTEEVKNFAIKARTLAGQVPFGLAFVPDPVTASRSGKTDSGIPYLNLSDLPPVANDLMAELGRSIRFAVIGLDFQAEDPALQAAMYSFAYRASANIKADFCIYRTQSGARTGLYDEQMNARPVAKAFLSADTASNSEGESYAAALLGEDWKKLSVPRTSRVLVEDTANTGTSGDPGNRWFDFASEQYPKATPTGSATEPALIDSASLGSKVLTASLTRTPAGDGSGYRFDFENAKKLKDIYVLSARLLPQVPSEGERTATVSLLIEGTAADGRALSYESSIDLSCNNWQTVSFHVRDYTAQMDEKKPCTVTFLMETDGEYAMWLHAVNTRKAAANLTFWAILLPIVGGLLVAVIAVWLISRRGKRRKNA